MPRMWLWCFALMGCSEFKLHNAADEIGGEDADEDPPYESDVLTPTDPDSVDTGEDFSDDTAETPDTGEPVETGPPEHVPEVCSVETMVQMAGTGPLDCPTDYAAFMMDDGRGPNFICCPLPATDILIDPSTVDRGSACGPEEVITGFTGQYAFRCTRVNLDRYQIGSAVEPCYFGSGASGGSGVPGCDDHPHTWDVLQQNLFGSDGCSGYPYGSLFVSQTNKDCEDMRTVQILYNGTVDGDPPAGTPVDMFTVE